MAVKELIIKIVFFTENIIRFFHKKKPPSNSKMLHCVVANISCHLEYQNKYFEFEMAFKWLLYYKLQMLSGAESGCAEHGLWQASRIATYKFCYEYSWKCKATQGKKSRKEEVLICVRESMWTHKAHNGMCTYVYKHI